MPLLLAAVLVVIVAGVILWTSGTVSDRRPSSGPPSESAAASTAASPASGQQGWPDATNTGVPPSVEGELRRVDDLVVTDDNAHYTRLDIEGCVDVKADNVEITESVIRCSRNGPAVRTFDGVKNLVLDQVEIDGLGKASTCVGFDNVTISRSNLHDCNDGVDFGSNVVIERSYIHDLARGDDTHNDAVQTLGGSNDVIKDSTLEAYRASTDDLMNSAIQTGHLSSPLTNVLIQHNYLDGGNYTVNAGATSTNGLPIQGYVFKDNVFGRHFRYGPVQAVGPGTTFDSSNVWADDGTPVDAGG